MTEDLTDEDMSTINSQTPRKSTLAMASLALSVLGVLFGTLSIMRIRTVQDMEACLIAETTAYRLVHALSSILPAAAFGTGILALMRIFHSRGGLRGKALATAGLILSAAILVFYSINLVHLASDHAH